MMPADVLMATGELVSAYGLPTAIALGLFQLYREERKAREAERAEWVGAIEEHTAAIRELCDELGVSSPSVGADD